MFCPKCGHQVSDDAAFCGECGNPVRRDDVHGTNPEAPSSFRKGSPSSALPYQVNAGKRISFWKRPLVLGAFVVGIVLLSVGLFAIGGYNSVSMIGSDSTGSSDMENPETFVIPETVDIKDNLAQYTWPELKAIAGFMAESESTDAAIDIAADYNLCDRGGNVKNMAEKSVVLSDGREYSVRIIGLMHDRYSDDVPAAMTFMFTEGVTKMPYSAENFRSWELSALCVWLNHDFFDSLPFDLQRSITVVEKPTTSGPLFSYSVWSPSVVELIGTCSESAIKQIANGSYAAKKMLNSFNMEGSQYSYFRESGCGYRDNDPRGALMLKYEGEPCDWYERTIPSMDEKQCMIVEDDGEALGHQNAKNNAAVVPFFCI